MRPVRGAMSNQRYPEELKIEAVKQVTERGLPIAEVAARLSAADPRVRAVLPLAGAAAASINRRAYAPASSARSCLYPSRVLACVS